MTRITALICAALFPAVLWAGDANVAGSDGTRSIGHLECASEDGKPLSSCPYEALPKEDGSLTLRIFLPNGETRSIYVKDGKPDSSDSLGDMGSRRLNRRTVILIPPAERYEIPNVILDQKAD